MEKGQRLTEMTKASGCAAKLGPGALDEILSRLPNRQDKDLLVGYDSSDDACVYRVSDRLAIVETVDFFTPSWTTLIGTASSPRPTPSATYTPWEARLILP